MDPDTQHQYHQAESMLGSMLSAAVPLLIIAIIDRGGITFEDIKRIKSSVEDLMGPKGADLFFKSEQSGETAKRFNQLADVIAVLSFFPGGVTLFGQHYDGNAMKEQMKSRS
ncbi:MAG TPA: hypothetical protein VKR06_00750 [Ktedonosporobacter sp.]|nr:hypothetical protein [Ktedonosporobacter sp.]